MAAFKRCKVCGVPVRVGKDHVWSSDGTIAQRRDRDHRMIFFDSEGIDALFQNIEQLIGMPIEKMIIESKARATAAYISHLMRGIRGPAARVVGLGRVIQRVIDQGRVMGYGDINMVSFSWKNLKIVNDVSNPYSLPLFCGDMRGSVEAIRKVEGTVAYEQQGPGRYVVTAWHEAHASELEGRLTPKRPPRKQGDIAFNFCPGCGVPVEISQFKWDTEAGTITHEPTGVRYAIFGPAGLQAIFDELERELGESIPEAIIEAQRMHVESRMGNQWKAIGGADLKGWLRGWLAMQGMGNLRELDLVDGVYRARMENPAAPLVLLGTAAALFEFMTESKGVLEWSVADDGDLSFTISPAG